MATPVVSLPVPAVVGTGSREQVRADHVTPSEVVVTGRCLPAMSGLRAPVTGFPLPTGALTKSRKSASGWQAYRLAALQVSITEPPPTATNTSKEPLLANAMASLKLQHTQGTDQTVSSQPIREQDPPLSPGVGGLHPDFVVDFVLDSVLHQRLQDGLHRREAGQVLVSHEADVPSSEVPQVLQENRRTTTS